METGCSCWARWWIAAAAHNICVLIGQIACQSSGRTVNYELQNYNSLFEKNKLADDNWLAN